MERKLILVLAAIAGLFVLGSGAIHLREWLEIYRDVPSQVEGAFVVTVGFPLHAATALLGVVALAAAVIWRASLIRPFAVALLAFEAASIAVLVQTRSGSVFGWTEPTWTPAAEQTLAIEIGAVVAIAAVLGVGAWLRRSPETTYPDGAVLGAA